MTATVATPRPGPTPSNLTVGQSSAIYQIAAACFPNNPDALRSMALTMVNTWQELDRECNHPQDPDHAHAPLR